MTFDTEKVKAGRKPVSECELVLDSCRFEYGKSYENILAYSEDFSSWGQIGTGSVGSNVLLAPDGEMTADLLTDTDTAAGNAYWDRLATVVNDAKTRTFSVYLKEGTSPEVTIGTYYTGGTTVTGNAAINWATKTISLGVGDAAEIEYIGDGWYRAWITITNNASGNTTWRGRIQPAVSAGDTGSVYVWGGQGVEGNKPGHYVKTTTVAATDGCSASNAKANLITYSNAFDNAAWTKVNGITVGANLYKNPDGTTDAEKLTYDGTASPYIYQYSGTLDPSGKTYTSSWWAKIISGQPTGARLYIYGNSGLEAIESEALTLTTEWKRYSVTTTFPASASSTAVVCRFDGPSAPSASEYQIVCWAQLVEGSIPGNYYETTTTAHTGSIGTECYNTWSTCEVQDDYLKLIKGHRYSMPVHPVIPGTIPCMITEPRFTSAIADPDNGLGVRSQVSINLRDFAHHDRGFDPYVYGRTYTPQDQGTHFGKTLARNPYWTGRPLIVRTGYHADTGLVTRSRAYVLDKFSLDDNASIVGKDLLKLADNSRTQIPTLSDAELLADITAIATSCTLDDYDQLPDASGTLAIGDEVMDYVKVGSPATSLTLSNRGKWGTTAEDHEAGDNVQHAYIFTQNVVDEIFDLLNIYVGIGKQYLPYDAKQDVPTGTNDEWDDEHDIWLVGHNFNSDGIIVKPTGVSDVIRVLTRISAIFLWWDEIDQEVKLKANMPPAGNPTIPVINENSHFVKGSVRTKELPDQRISQATIHYNRIVATGDDKASNYAGHTSRRDANSESGNEYGTKRIREYFAKYYATAAVPTAAANRLVNRFRTEPKDVWFNLDAKDESIRIGDTYDIETRRVQDVTGANETYRIQIQEMRETKAGHLYTYRGRTSVFDRRYMFIGTTGIPDYGSATDAQKASVGFISTAGGGDFADGGSAYYII